MHFNKMKHDIRARLSVAKMMSSSDTFSQPVSLLFNIPYCHYHAK